MCEECFSDIFFDIIACLVESPPFTLPRFNEGETFIVYIASSHFIEFSFFTTTMNIVFSERQTNFLTRIKKVKAAHWFEHGVAMTTKNINSEAVNFLLSACCIEALNFAMWSCSL